VRRLPVRGTASSLPDFEQNVHFYSTVRNPNKTNPNIDIPIRSGPARVPKYRCGGFHAGRRILQLKKMKIEG
jgi:hypothetical protein